MKPNPTPEPAVLRPKQACAYLGFGRTQLHYLENNDPTFPRKIRFSVRCVGWRRADLDAWLALRAAQANGGAA